MKKLCFLLCLMLTLATLVSCSRGGDDEATDPPETSTKAPEKEEGLVLSVSDEIEIGVGESMPITVINAKTGMQTTTVHWSSDNKDVVDVDFEGNITGIADGTAVITAASIDGQETASCTVTVISVLSGVELDATELTVTKGSTATLTASLIPATYTGAELQWVSSDKSVASVENGVITALKNGSTTIAVSAEGFTAVCSVKVVTPVTSVTLSDTALTLVKGDSKDLVPTVKPSDATDYKLTWTTSNPSAVSVENGKVTALSGGTATITAKTSNGISASCTVTVSVPVTGVTLTPTEVKLDPGVSQKLTVSIAPIDANEQGVLWDTNNPAVATVDEYGMVKALTAGTAVIKVTTVEGYFTASCTVTVATSVTALAFEDATDELLPNESIKLVPVKTPADAPDPLYSWTTSDPFVAKVDTMGVVTALKPGTVTITVALENGINATHTITVIDPATIITPITGITVKDKEVNAGDKFKLDISIQPAGANEKYTVVSRNTNCVVVNSDGTLTASRKGTVKIEVKSASGAAVGSCYITVKDPDAEKRVQLQKDYDAAKVALDTAHNDAIAAIGTKYDGSIQTVQSSVDAYDVKNEADYNAKKAALEQQIAAEANTAQKATLQQQLNNLNADWAGYTQAITELSNLQNAKNADVDAENASYNQKIEALNEQYAFLFE